MENKPLWALGLMSGTSADGVDGALLQTDGVTISNFGPTFYSPYPYEIKREIFKAYGKRSNREMDSLSQEITHHHAEVVFALIEKARMKISDIDLIGFHGHTIFHKPPFHGKLGETYQIGDGKLLTFLTKIPVVEQFRLNDMAYGGQGAPLVPVFHRALSHNLPKPLGIINIGGVANFTWIENHQDNLLGFDTGPGNSLIDDWVRKKVGLPWDEGGKIAIQGRANEHILEQWLLHPYFSQKPPKSLDRNTFQSFFRDIELLSVEDGVATLTAFTAASLKKALDHLPQKPLLCLIAGGGAHNDTLLEMCKKRMEVNIKKISEMGWNGDALEAQAFAFLAVRSFKGLPLTYPGTTGVPYPLTGGTIRFPSNS